jgi:hypothetical protein
MEVAVVFQTLQLVLKPQDEAVEVRVLWLAMMGPLFL